MRRKQNLIYLFKGLDFKMDRQTAILRSGTPLLEMTNQDLPSPTNDPQNMKQMPFNFKFRVLRKKTQAEDPD
jgi:hypothetical protein